MNKEDDEKYLYQVEGIGSYKDGKPEGEWKWYHENGKLETIASFKDGKAEGEWKWYHENGKLETIGSFKGGKAEGEWKSYYKNGQLSGITYYKDGKEEGEYKGYWDNGGARYIGSYKDGKREGEWKEYYPNGYLEKIKHYKNGKLIKTEHIYVYKDFDYKVLEKIELKGFQYHFIYDGDNEIFESYSTDILHKQDIPEYDFNNGDILVHYSEEVIGEEKTTGYIRWSEEVKKWFLTGRHYYWLWDSDFYELTLIEDFDKNGESGFKECQLPLGDERVDDIEGFEFPNVYAHLPKSHQDKHPFDYLGKLFEDYSN